MLLLLLLLRDLGNILGTAGRWLELRHHTASGLLGRLWLLLKLN